MASVPCTETIMLVPLLLVVFVGSSLAAPPHAKRREVITARTGAVAADDGRCSAIGRDALLDGGTAVDAAVATALCLGVVSPASSGIGGGAFLLVRTATGEAVVFDGRETAPLLAHENMYNGVESAKASGPLSIAVPSELAALHAAWKRYGKLPWKRLVLPAARLADTGYAVSPFLHFQLNATRAGILRDDGLRAIYTSGGEVLAAGDVCRNKHLARTLEAVADHGPRALYHGSVGANLVEDVQKLGGVLTMVDLKSYRVKIRKPIHRNVMNATVVTMPPPSAGGAGIVLILNILEKYGVPAGVLGSVGIHRLIESLKHYIAVKMNVGDPDFVNDKKVLADMLSPEFAAALKKTIFDNRTFNDPRHYGRKWNILQDHGTSHISIVDGMRNAVSMTSTVNSYFGSLILSPRTGILLNNEMDDFSMPSTASSASRNSLPPAPADFARPRKRPLSSMAPTVILKDGQLSAVIGASGGAMIPAGIIQVFLNHFAKGMDPLSAVLSPRVYHQLIPNVVRYEDWRTVTGDHFLLPAATRDDLRKKGHILEPISGGTICQLVVVGKDDGRRSGESGELTAVADPRKGGVPAGY